MSSVSWQWKWEIKTGGNPNVSWKYLFLKYNLTYFKFMTVFWQRYHFKVRKRTLKTQQQQHEQQHYVHLIFTGGVKVGHGTGSAVVPLEVQPNPTLKRAEVNMSSLGDCPWSKRKMSLICLSAFCPLLFLFLQASSPDVGCASNCAVASHSCAETPFRSGHSCRAWCLYGWEGEFSGYFFD